MPNYIDFREIAIFRYFEADARQALAASFVSQIRSQGDLILKFGKPVPGIFILVEGEVSVCVPNINSSMAVLGRGQSFGEMSLIEETESASADVSVKSAEAKLLFCSVDHFKEILTQVPGSAYSFYKASAQLISMRLRRVMVQLNKDLGIGAGSSVTDILKTSELGSNLSQTRSELDKTGDKVVSKLMQVMPLIDSLQSKFPQAQAEIEVLRKNLEDIFLVDSQSFDRMSQQLNLIQQHFENLRRVANGGGLLPLEGDANLFLKP